MKSIASRALALTGVAFCVLWTADIVVRLELLTWLRRPGHFYAPPDRFAGLLAMEACLSLFLALAALLATPLLSRLPRSPGPRQESVALLAAITSGLLVRERLISPSRYPEPVLILAVAAAALITWFLIRGLTHSVHNPPRQWMALGARALLLPLAIGMLAQVIHTALRQHHLPKTETFFCLLLLGMAGLCAVPLRPRSERWRDRLLFWVPVAVAMLLAVLASQRANQYGRPVRRTGSPGAGDRPSLVLIVLDTARADHLQLQGYARNTMPYLETWAAGSLVFERAVAPGGWTAPTHASLFSGRTVSLHGVHYSGQESVTKTAAVDGIDWLPALLARDGYTTLAVTANELALPARDLGFDATYRPSCQQFGGTLAALLERLLPPLQVWSDRLRWRMPYADAASIRRIVERAVPGRDQPLFLFINLLDAHAPYNPPPRAIDAMGRPIPHLYSRYLNHKEITLLWESLPAMKEQCLQDLYDAELRWMDFQLARLLPWLVARLGDNCLIVITSDHGEELGEEGRVGHEYGLPQRLIHVPLILRGPGIAAGSDDRIVTIRRLFDFFLAAARGQRPAGEFLTVQDSLGTLSERYPTTASNSPRNPEPERHWVAEFAGSYKVLGPSAYGWRAYDIEATGFRDGVPLADTTVVRALRRRVDEYWQKHRDRRVDQTGMQTLTDEELERLRSLGYIK